MIQVIN